MDWGHVWAFFFLLLCFCVLGLHIFSLPANWVLLVLVAVWKATHPVMALSWWGFAGLCVLAAVAELLEYILQLKGSKKYGASGKGNFGGIVGAIVGSIVGAGFLFGVGALPGALLGAFVGCLLVELLLRRSLKEAMRASWGAMMGKFFGLIAKAGFGGVIFALVVSPIWG